MPRTVPKKGKPITLRLTLAADERLRALAEAKGESPGAYVARRMTAALLGSAVQHESNARTTEAERGRA